MADDLRARVRELVGGGLAAIEAHRRRIDDLNVYPVPDGDTGTNLTLTVRAVADALREDGAADRAGIAREVARAALLGARGNSGVILSQIVRGAADALAEDGGLATVFVEARDAAYRAVREPVEGTMLTAIAAMADAAVEGGDLAAIVARGDDAVVRTRELLPVLTQAGVVDAGAAGLVEIVRGVAAALNGDPLPHAPAHEPELGLDAVHLELSRYRYCTLFVVEGDAIDVAALEAELEPLGDSLLVVGDPTTVKVHVHTDDPGRALSAAVARGVVGGVEIANMHEQTHRREERLLHPVTQADDERCAAVAVVAGEGNRLLLESLGAIVVDGGGTMNPSTGDLLSAIDGAGAPEVVVLPNNANAIMSAEQAAAQSSKVVSVVPTRSLQAGIAALVAFDPASGVEENEAQMAAAADAVATGAVAVASRDVELNGVSVQAGKWLGLAAGEPVAGGDTFDDVATVVLERLLAQPRSVVTLLTGQDAPQLDRLLAALEAAHPELEVEVHAGGQPHYPLLLSAE